MGLIWDIFCIYATYGMYSQSITSTPNIIKKNRNDHSITYNAKFYWHSCTVFMGIYKHQKPYTVDVPHKAASHFIGQFTHTLSKTGIYTGMVPCPNMYHLGTYEKWYEKVTPQ